MARYSKTALHFHQSETTIQNPIYLITSIFIAFSFVRCIIYIISWDMLSKHHTIIPYHIIYHWNIMVTLSQRNRVLYFLNGHKASRKTICRSNWSVRGREGDSVRDFEWSLKQGIFQKHRQIGKYLQMFRIANKN